MRRLTLISMALLVVCSAGYADDYLRMEIEGGYGTGYEGAVSDVVWYILRECPDPEVIIGASVGFTVTATGDVTWGFDDGYTPGPEQHILCSLGGMLFTDYISGTGMTDGWFCIDCASVPGDGGIPIITTEREFFRLTFEWGCLPTGGGGQICFDSSSLDQDCNWKFSGLTCGEGGAPDRPLFLCGPGSDDIHPCCIDIEELSCTDPTINVTPDGDLIELGVCDTASFLFDADPGVVGPNPATIIGWEITSGIGTIDNNGLYNAVLPPGGPGDYEVTIRVVNDCICNWDEYAFTVRFTNHEPYFAACTFDCSDPYALPPCYFGSTMRIPLGSTDLDTCDSLTKTITGLYIQGDGFDGTVSLEGDYLHILFTPTDGDVLLCVIVTVEDEYGGYGECEVPAWVIPTYLCGNADQFDYVDIDDIVYLVAYVFSSGPPPEPYEVGDVDCSGQVDIDDVVYLVVYSFSAGPEPCAECPM